MVVVLEESQLKAINFFVKVSIFLLLPLCQQKGCWIAKLSMALLMVTAFMPSEFIHTHLIAHLQPFNGSNPHSVVILDNTSIHHNKYAVKAIEDIGALVHFFTSIFP